MSVSMEKARIDHQVLTPIFSRTEPDRNTLAEYQIHLATFFGISVPECLGRCVGTHPEKLWVKIPNYFCLSAYSTAPCVTPFRSQECHARSPRGAHGHRPKHWPDPRLATSDSFARDRLHSCQDVLRGLRPKREYACGRYTARPHRHLGYAQ